MQEILIPASCANLGPGFDTLGLAINIFNHFTFEKSSTLKIEGVDSFYATEKNLFYIAFQKVLEKINKKSSVHVIFDSHIPISRGLGSSASLIVGGAKAANMLFGNKLNDKEIFDICTKIEGHPDNIAPALFHGFNASLMDNGKPYHIKMKISKNLFFTIYIPNFKTSTKVARSILPKMYKKEAVIHNISRAIIMCEALKIGDIDLIKKASSDMIHEPYRKTLIKDYNYIKKEALNKGAIAFLISGSGPTCISISTNKYFSKELNIRNTISNWDIIDVKII
ncbi:MAG: homoserine kinase [Eubacteriales bacterium]|nr:homoserine kinase [Eubacteriales bacterium]